jgi:hypothetical protein
MPKKPNLGFFLLIVCKMLDVNHTLDQEMLIIFFDFCILRQLSI